LPFDSWIHAAVNRSIIPAFVMVMHQLLSFPFIDGWSLERNFGGWLL